MHRDTEAEELTFPRPCHRAFLGVDAQLQGSLEESPDSLHHPITRCATAHINVAIVRIAAKCEFASFQLLVQVSEKDVREQRGERTALRCTLRALLDQPLAHHPGFQEPSDQLEHSCIADLPCHPCHQHIVVDPIEELLQINVHHPTLSLTDVTLCFANRLMGPATRTEAEA